ncbi:MAG: hypothetical protein P4M00_20745 [Azospirillaceae bacterium]|nr:hypothetical protein [Azospirillaceae bacterium]
MKSGLAVCAVTAALLAAAPLSSAQADGWHHHDDIGLGLLGAVVAGTTAAVLSPLVPHPVYVAQPPVYYAPPPPVYYAPPAAYYPPPPRVYYAPPPRVVYYPGPAYYQGY